MVKRESLQIFVEDCSLDFALTPFAFATLLKTDVDDTD